MGHFPAAKTTAIGWPMRCYGRGQDPPKSLDLEELTELTAAAAQSSEAGHAKTNRARLTNRAGFWSLVTADLCHGHPDEVPGYLALVSCSGSALAHIGPLHTYWLLYRTDNSNIGTLEIPTKVQQSQSQSQ